jgi:hypothetical protein
MVHQERRPAVHQERRPALYSAQLGVTCHTTPGVEDAALPGALRRAPRNRHHHGLIARFLANLGRTDGRLKENLCTRPEPSLGPTHAARSLMGQPERNWQGFTRQSDRALLVRLRAHDNRYR